MKHVGALVGITVLVFGTTYLFTSDWPLGGTTEETAAVSEAPASQEVAETEPAEAAPAEPAPVDETLLAEGQSLYVQCQACHGPEGQGSVGPAFAGDSNIQDVAYTLQTIVHGRGAMPAFGERFDDTEIASVATFIRNSWGNEFGGVTPEDVAAAREAGPAE